MIVSTPVRAFTADRWNVRDAPMQRGLSGGCSSCSGLGALDAWWPFPGLPMWPALIGAGLLTWWLIRPRLAYQFTETATPRRRRQAKKEKP